MKKKNLHNRIKYFLNEAIDDASVLDAVRNKYYVRIKYDDGMSDNGMNSKGSRVIQPMAIGTTKKGYPVVRAFQVGGGSRRGAPNWKFFRLDRITSWLPMKKKNFFTPPDSSFGEYNRTGDKTMGMFVDNSKFNDLNSPLERARAERQNVSNAPKVSTKNAKGPISANQQWKKNVFTSQPNSKKYAQIAKNVNNTEKKDDDFWKLFDLNDAENALMQNQRGPVNNDDQYDINDVDYDENNFVNNNNR